MVIAISDADLDFEVPRHRLTITKHCSYSSNHPASGGPTYYPCSDTICAEVIVRVPGQGYQRQAFPFLREKAVAAVDADSMERFNNVLLAHGIELDLESNPVFDKMVTTFEDAGFSSGEVEDTLIAEPRFINGHPVGNDNSLESGELEDSDSVEKSGEIGE